MFNRDTTGDTTFSKAHFSSLKKGSNSNSSFETGMYTCNGDNMGKLSKIELYKCVASHTAWRSFATNVYRR